MIIIIITYIVTSRRPREQQVLAVTLARPGLISARDIAEPALETSISTGAGTGKTDIRGSGLHNTHSRSPHPSPASRVHLNVPVMPSMAPPVRAIHGANYDDQIHTSPTSLGSDDRRQTR
jgi:hypothetical protein